MEHTITKPSTGTWTVDPTHTSVTMSVKHLMAATVRGSMSGVAGTIEQGATADTTSVSVALDAATINTGVADRDAHLRSPDFLDVENHPTITFDSSKITEHDGGFKVEGDLTIKSVTKPVTIDMSYGGLMTDPWGNEKAIFSGETVLNREEFGLTWNQALETGGVLVGKNIKVELEVQAAKAA